MRFGFPLFGDEVASGNIALDILEGKIAPFYQQAEGREALYSYTMALAFALLGDREIANRWPSVDWSMAFVALMFVNALVFPDHPDGLRVAFQVLAAPAIGLIEAFWDPSDPIYVDPRVEPGGLRPLHIYHIPRARLDEHLAVARSNRVYIPGSETMVEAPVRAGDLLEFLGYKITNPEVQPGDNLQMLTYWGVLHPPPEMATFVHLMSPEDQVVSQYDGFDVIVEDLEPGDVVVQLHALPLPPDLPDAEYRIALGAYTREDLKRIPLSTGTDHMILETW